MNVQFRRLSLAALTVTALLVLPAYALAQEAQPQTDSSSSMLTDGIRLGVKTGSLFGAITPSATADVSVSPSPQSSRHEGIGIGVKAGPVFSKLSETGFNFSNRTGFMGGLFIGGNRPGVIGVMVEFDYAKKGTKNQDGTTTDLYYLEVPVLLRANFGSNSLNGVNVYVIGGPEFAIQLKGSLNGVDIKDNFETLDIDVVAGGGVEITRFIIEVRGDWGLRNINKLSSTNKIHNRSAALLFGIRFN